MTPDARERILKTPLKAVGNLVHVAAASYHVATVSRGMNDPEDYAKLFADAPRLLATLRDVLPSISIDTTNPPQIAALTEAYLLLRRHGMEV